jgi:hypothetical protein
MKPKITASGLLNRTFIWFIMEELTMKNTYMKIKIFCSAIFLMILVNTGTFAQVFNKNLTEEEQKTLDRGDVLIKNIAYAKNMSLNKDYNTDCQALTEEIKQLSPKYLAEIIQIKPYKGNENLPEILTGLLYNVSEYKGIPYYSERHKKYYNLYDSAKIEKETVIVANATKTQKELEALFDMEPFGKVYETINLTQTLSSVYYSAINTNKLRYKDEFDCVWPKKLKICIILFRDGENWVLYGIGGVNAPRIPFFTERIETSFINRIKTFCSFIFSKF